MQSQAPTTGPTLARNSLDHPASSAFAHAGVVLRQQSATLARVLAAPVNFRDLTVKPEEEVIEEGTERGEDEMTPSTGRNVSTERLMSALSTQDLHIGSMIKTVSRTKLVIIMVGGGG